MLTHTIKTTKKLHYHFYFVQQKAIMFQNLCLPTEKKEGVHSLMIKNNTF